jgi:vacuolar-type H+-ATPase subunit E/Vma4
VSDIALWQSHQKYISDLLNEAVNLPEDKKNELKQILVKTKETLKHIKSQDYYDKLVGTIGKDDLYKG